MMDDLPCQKDKQKTGDNNKSQPPRDATVSTATTSILWGQIEPRQNQSKVERCLRKSPKFPILFCQRSAKTQSGKTCGPRDRPATDLCHRPLVQFWGDPMKAQPKRRNATDPVQAPHHRRTAAQVGRRRRQFGCTPSPPNHHHRPAMK